MSLMGDVMDGNFECEGFTFFQDFDSGNLGRVEFVGEQPETEMEEHLYEFNLWTKPDNAGTPYENGNRTWFHFGVRGGKLNTMLKLNINTNKQSKMYGQGMAPVFRVLPGRPNWERIRDRPMFTGNQSKFTLTFKHRLQDNDRVCTYFAFTYPFSFTELLGFLSNIELCYRPRVDDDPTLNKADEIYYHREILCYSLERRRVDLITISSHHNITADREPRFTHLFPDVTVPRAFKFDKEVIFLSARVHPGETPSSFVMSGMISFLMTRDDPVAVMLRKNFVFKIIPMLNPDGVYCGNYRTDTKGVNLNRVYLNPSPTEHPSIYGARKLLLYYHFGKEIDDPAEVKTKQVENLEDGVSDLRLRPKSLNVDESCEQENDLIDGEKLAPTLPKISPEESGLFLYIDMHGHASKKGIFMYGNHFDNLLDNVECMLFPKLISLNSQHFHFDSCNFSERIMYLKDKKDGSSREGAGRVAVLKTTGLVRSYTLECNYNTGKRVNPLAPPIRESLDKRPVNVLLTPPKYTPQIFEEVGRAILSSVLDLIGAHPNSRLNNTSHRTLNNVRESLKHQVLSEMPITNSGSLPQVKSSFRSKRGENKRSRSITSSCESKMRPRSGKGHAASTVLSSKELRRGSMAHAVEVVMNKKRAGRRTESPRLARLEKKESRESRRLQPEQRQRRKKLRPKETFRVANIISSSSSTSFVSSSEDEN